MQQAISITVLHTTVVEDALGDSTSTPTETVYRGCLFAPRSSDESRDTRQPAVITGATIYRRGTGLEVDANDTIRIANVSPMIDGDWNVVGQPGYWGTAGIEFAITRGTPSA